MLLNYYYSIKKQQTTESVTLFDVTLLPECSVYEGHFPGMPIAPGVCTIQMIKECVERITGKQLLLESIAQCKFIKLISPQQHSELQIRIELAENEDKRTKAIATISKDETEYMLFKGEFVVFIPL
ncbi:MAG: beta-hydroxyacyl-ACP dehydratase [Tannerella sp.]|jgi:3-hydroxyacyl-[acyl-carrier-protein] dehydratase|nr:beta-hydroxyacyl-ACP dehydratase [Tannerella sp.]